MRHTTTGLVLLATAGIALAGCSSSGSSGSPSPAQRLATRDGGAHPAAAYQDLLDGWAKKCTEPASALAGYADASLTDLKKNGVTGESEYTVLVHLDAATPTGSRTKCEDIAAAYLTMRESQ